jgi:hypothetical protein
LFPDIPDTANTETEIFVPDEAIINSIHGRNFVPFLSVTVNHRVQMKVKVFHPEPVFILMMNYNVCSVKLA